MMFTATRLTLVGQMQAVRDETLSGTTLELYQNDVVPTRSSTAEDFVVANFSGYSNVAVGNFSSAYWSQSGRAEVSGPALQFEHSGGPVGNIIYGYILFSSGGDLLGGDRLPNPVPLSGDQDGLVVVPTLTLG